MRALIIDDDPINRMFMQEILSNHSQAVAVGSGAEGVQAFRRSLADGQPFDAILLDVHMPDMDGHQTLQKIRRVEHEAGIPATRETTVMMVSADGDSRNVNRAFFQGRALSYLTKPVDPDVLIDELRKFGLIG